MTFLEAIFERLAARRGSPVVQEIRDGRMRAGHRRRIAGAWSQQARAFLRGARLEEGRSLRAAGANSIRWVALDLALMAEGIIVVPLYARQAPPNWSRMMKDATPSRIFCPDARWRRKFKKLWPQAPHISLLEAFSSDASSALHGYRRSHHEDRTTLGHHHLHFGNFRRTERRGAQRRQCDLHAGLHECAPRSADGLAQRAAGPGFPLPAVLFRGLVDPAAHFLSRNSMLTLSTDLTKLADELKLAAPNYFLNVPTLLERVRARSRGIHSEARRIRRGDFSRRAARRIPAPSQRADAPSADSLWLALARIADVPDDSQEHRAESERR